MSVCSYKNVGSVAENDGKSSSSDIALSLQYNSYKKTEIAYLATFYRHIWINKIVGLFLLGTYIMSFFLLVKLFIAHIMESIFPHFTTLTNILPLQNTSEALNWIFSRILSALKNPVAVTSKRFNALKIN